MNDIIELKGTFLSRKNKNVPSYPKLPSQAKVNANHVHQLIQDLKVILNKWENDTLIDGALISVHYIQVVAKSNRIKAIFLDKNDSICGSKFETIDNKINHVFTHYMSLNELEKAIVKLEIAYDILLHQFNGEMNQSKMESIHNNKNQYNFKDISLTMFMQLIVDSYYVRRFNIDEDVSEMKDNVVITIYKTKFKTVDLLRKIGIHLFDHQILDDVTMRLTPKETELLKEKAPYLIAMQVKDLQEIPPFESKSFTSQGLVKIPKPTNEPIIGVIDTLFDEQVYFHEWVDYQPRLDKNISETTTLNDCVHGTSVTSIIVDGATINPDLDDGCGRFRVRHFGVATGNNFSAFTILRQIREIVITNTDIKVWNLSLGSALEVHPNFISLVGAELDDIQSKYDIIFVVAGTNISEKFPNSKRIGSPADSINSMVVNSVTRDQQPASYHRTGPVLSFFYKPDVSYYGGDQYEPIKVCGPFGERYVAGTSFAAPWIARKLAYLICKMGLSREIAKALIIDSAAGWNRKDDISHAIGYGVVPIRIEDILKSPSDEIRFVLMETIEQYEAYNYHIPVPSVNKKQPFLAKATLCYFPKCSRNQGVDYTDTELDIHFGRVKIDKSKITIDDINENKQDEKIEIGIYEDSARKNYRKWDNIKHINEKVNSRKRPKSLFGNGDWGISIKAKERLSTQFDKTMPFGVVITLKEMNGQNRIDEFIKLCMARGWMVNQINVDNRIHIYNKIEEDVKLE